MKSSLLFLSFFLFIRSGLFAQRVVEVTYALDTKGRYIFSCNNKAFCNYVLKLEFTTLNNATADHVLPFEAEVKPGVSKLLVLTPVNTQQEVKINYKSSYRKGCIDPVVNPDYVYLLPVAPGVETQAYRIPNTHGTGPGIQDSGYSVRLRANLGDTIYAARRGVVTDVDVSNTENDAGATTTTNWNFIEIVHADCSFAQYGILKKDGALVRAGQTVEAGTPIGIVGGDRYGRGSEIRFSVTSYPGLTNTGIPLLFWTKGNGKGQLKHGATYYSEFPKALVMREQPKPAAGKSKKPVAHH
jgi:hypothetical protein